MGAIRPGWLGCGRPATIAGFGDEESDGPGAPASEGEAEGFAGGTANTHGFEGNEDEAEEDEAEDGDVAADHPFAVPGDDTAAEGEALAGWAEPEEDGSGEEEDGSGEEGDGAAEDGGWVLVADCAGGMEVMQSGDQPEGNTQDEGQGDEGQV